MMNRIAPSETPYPLVIGLEAETLPRPLDHGLGCRDFLGKGRNFTRDRGRSLIGAPPRSMLAGSRMSPLGQFVAFRVRPIHARSWGKRKFEA